jgi:hypothetical protein
VKRKWCKAGRDEARMMERNQRLAAPGPKADLMWRGLTRALYFFSRSSVASLRNIGRSPFAAFARSQGNETSMRSASSSTSMLAAPVWPSARMRKRNVSPSQVSCSIAIMGPR